MAVPGVQPRRPNLNAPRSFGNLTIEIISCYSCLFEKGKKKSPRFRSQNSAGQKQRSSSSSPWPFHSYSMLFPRSGLGLWLHVMLCLQLSAFRLQALLQWIWRRFQRAHSKYVSHPTGVKNKMFYFCKSIRKMHLLVLQPSLMEPIRYLYGQICGKHRM